MPGDLHRDARLTLNRRPQVRVFVLVVGRFCFDIRERFHNLVWSGELQVRRGEEALQGRGRSQAGRGGSGQREAASVVKLGG